HAETLQQLGIVIELAALPEAHAEEGGDGPGLAALAQHGQAVGPVVRRAERRIALEDEGGLAVQLPGAGPALVAIALRLVVGDTELVVQADTEAVQVVLRIVARRR